MGILNPGFAAARKSRLLRYKVMKKTYKYNSVTRKPIDIFYKKFID
jgi:hypothetical protein